MKTKCADLEEPLTDGRYFSKNIKCVWRGTPITESPWKQAEDKKKQDLRVSHVVFGSWLVATCGRRSPRVSNVDLILFGHLSYLYN